VEKIIKHVYIHYPFCTTQCGYCSFYTEQFSAKLQETYLKTLAKEIEYYQANSNYKFELETIYFGGGTPSLLAPRIIKAITDMIIGENNHCEITMECNPITLSQTYVEELTISSVNRVSLGIQSMNSIILKYIGRKHSPQQVIELLRNLRNNGYDNISGDLIYGIPYQTISDVKADIESFIKLNLDHISIYCLSLADDAPLAKDKKLIPDDDIVANMYQLICKKLTEAGYNQYEISNFARNNKYSRHNLAYWEQKDYLGLGPGAYQTIGNIRCNHGTFNEWQADIGFGRLYPNKEVLSDKDKVNEYIMLQLRLNKGLDPEQLIQKYSFDIRKEKKAIIAEFMKTGLLKENQERLCLTNKSRFISNYVISELMED